MLGLQHTWVVQQDRENAIEAGLRRRRLLGQLEGGNGSANVAAGDAPRMTAETHRAGMRPAGASIRNAAR
jgi:hypothetical protein